MKIPNAPWGQTAAVDSYHPQRLVLRVSFPDGGGYAVAKELDMPAHLASIGVEEGGYRWFEEDRAWAAAVTAFPDLFHRDHVEQARNTLRDWFPAAYMAHFGGIVTAANSKLLEQLEWEVATADKFVALGTFADCWNLPEGHVYAAGWRRRDEALAGFIVPQDRCTAAERLVLDEFPRWEPDRTLPFHKPCAAAVQVTA